MPLLDSLRRNNRLDWRRSLRETEESLWRLATKVLFVLAFIVIAALSVAVNPIFLSILLAFLAGQFIRAVLPASQIRSHIRSYWTGDAGDRWRRRFYGLYGWLTVRTARLWSGLVGLYGWIAAGLWRTGVWVWRLSAALLNRVRNRNWNWRNS